MLSVAGAQVLGGDVHDAVGIDIEGDLDLRHAAAGRGDAVQMEAAQALVGGSHLALALEDVHLHRGLIIGGGGEDLALLYRDGGVALDQTGAHAAHGLNAQGQGGDIQQQQALDIAGEHAGLKGGAHGHALIGVDALEGLAAGEVLHSLHHGGDTAGAAHHQDLGQVRGLQSRVGHSLAHGAHGGIHQVAGELIELSPGQGDIQVLGAGGVSGDIGQVNIAAGDAGELDLGLLGGLLQALHGNFIRGQVDAIGTLELADQVLHDALVEVVAAQAVVAGGGQDLDNAVVDLQDGDIEGAAAQVVDHDLLSLLFIHAIGQGRGGGLVDDTLDLETRDLAGILGGLALGIGEVGGDGDDRLGDGLAQVGLGVALQLLQDHGADLLGGVGLAVDVHLVVGAHLTLDGGDGAVGIGDGLTLCHLAHHTLAGLGKCHHRGSGAVALSVGDDNCLAAFHNGYAGIGCTQIDTDNFRHNDCLLNLYTFYWLTISCGPVPGIYFLNWPPSPWRSGPPCRPSDSPSEIPRPRCSRRKLHRRYA